MSRLFFVRHGQASFFGGNYDQLSETGYEQGRLLGRWLAGRDFVANRVFVGPLQRHRQSWEAVLEGWGKGAPSADRVCEHKDLEEYPAHLVFAHIIPHLAASDPEVAAWVQSWQNGAAAAKKDFQKVFEKIVYTWIGGEVDVPDVPTWQQFRQRVEAFVPDVQALGGGQTVLAFSSGGPLGVLVGAAMGLDDQQVVELSWTIRNSAWAEFAFDAERFSLSAFNVHPHLSENLITYR